MLLNSEAGALALAEGLKDPGELPALIPHLRDKAQGTLPSAARLAALRSTNWGTANREIEQELGRLLDQHAEVLSTFTSAYLEHGDTAPLAGAAEEAERGMFGKRKRAERFALTVKPLLTDGVNVAPAQVPGLTIGIEAVRAHASELSQRVVELLGELAPGSWTPLRPDAAGVAQASHRAPRTLRAIRGERALVVAADRRARRALPTGDSHARACRRGLVELAEPVGRRDSGA